MMNVTAFPEPAVTAGPPPRPLAAASSPWLARLAVLGFVLLVRAPGLAPSVIDWDESLYILGARALLHGHLPYVALFDNKPFGAYSLVAAAMAVFGQNVPVVRLAGDVAVAATALLLHTLARRAALPRGAGMAAALLYAAFSVRLGGLSTNTELLFAPFTAGAVLLAWSGRDATPRGQARAMLGAGLLIGLGCWIKTIVCLPGAALYLALAGSWLRSRRIGLRWLLGLTLGYGLLCLAPTLASGLFYWATGHFGAFWYSNFGFMGAYLALPLPPSEIARTVVACLQEIWPPLLLAGLALVFALRRGGAPLRRFTLAIALWTIMEILALVAPWKFYPHYFLVVLPPLCLLAGVALAVVAERSVLPHLRLRAAPVLALCIALVPLAASANLITPGWLNLPRPDVPRQVAAVLRRDPGATAWVVNSEPVIYFLAGLPLPTRFPFPPHLVGNQSPMTRTDPKAEIARILATRPHYLVIDTGRWDEVMPDRRPLIDAALREDYTLVDSIPSHPAPVQIWKLRAAAPPPAAAGR